MGDSDIRQARALEAYRPAMERAAERVANGDSYAAAVGVDKTEEEYRRNDPGLPHGRRLRNWLVWRTRMRTRDALRRRRETPVANPHEVRSVRARRRGAGFEDDSLRRVMIEQADLTPVERRAFDLVIEQGLSLAEAGRQMGYTGPGVKGIVIRVLEKLSLTNSQGAAADDGI